MNTGDGQNRKEVPRRTVSTTPLRYIHYDTWTARNGAPKEMQGCERSSWFNIILFLLALNPPERFP